MAGVPDGHPHRFRDRFAIELLLKGVPLTERYYTPWVRARQEQLEADVRRTWGEDPLAFRETKGTPEVRGRIEAVNLIEPNELCWR